MTLFTLALKPFLQPLPIDEVWMLFIIPIAAAIALVYKSLKHPHENTIIPQAIRLTVVIVVAIALASVGLHVGLNLLLG